MHSVHCEPANLRNLLPMESNLMFQNILEYNAAKRVEVLIVMRKLLKNGNLNFQDFSKNDVFDVLYHVLDDSRWEVRYQCLLLITAIISHGNDEIDSHMLLVIPKIILNLGHENVNVRRASLQVLHVYMKFTSNLQNFQKLFIAHGLENSEYIVRKGCIMSIGILFTSDFENENLFPLVECLAKHFVDGDASLFYPIFLAMQKLNELLGDSTFEACLLKLDDEAANTYKRVLSKFTTNPRFGSSASSQSGYHNANGVVNFSSTKHVKQDFGIFHPYIAESIKNDDWKVRAEAIEQMKSVIRQTPDFCDKISDMDQFMIFLSRLLEDSNFKVVIQVLSIYDLLIDKFKGQLKRFLKTFVTSILKRLGDSKLVVREHAVRVIHKLMHYVRPSDVLENLLFYKSSRNFRLREEIVNRVTAAVLTFPSYDFDFHSLCEVVAPLVADAKRRVRLAAMECFAALAQAMGPSRLNFLVTAVDDVELSCEAEGLLNAVQARLARRILPRCSEDGVVSYAVTIPSSACGQFRNASPMAADIEWIMAASGSSSSSTPPSRSKEAPDSSKQNEDLLAVSPIANAKLKDKEPGVVFRKDSYWFSSPELETVESDLKEEGSEMEENNHYLPKIVSDQKEDKVKPVIVPSSEKSTTVIQATLEDKRISENVKTRPIIMSSKIPVLSHLPARKVASDEPAVIVKHQPIRALSAQRFNTLSSLYLQNSSSRRVSHHTLDARVQNMIVDPRNIESAKRKISPGNTPLVRQPVLVRSPSLNSLGQLSNDVTTANQVLYGSYSPTKNMGNFGSYFRPNPGGVILAQPSPVHLDDVSVYNVAVLDESGKLSNSSIADGWEMLQANSLGEGWKKSVEAMPEVYEMHIDAPGQKKVTSPLDIPDNANISIAKITREKMLRRQQEIMQEAEERRISWEREQNQQHADNADGGIHLYPDNNCNSLLKYHNDIEASSCTADEDCTHLTVPHPQTPQTPPPKPVIIKPSQPVPEKRTDSAQHKGSAKPLSRSSSLKTPSALRKYSQNQTSIRNSHTSKYSLAASSLALFDESSNEVSTYPNPNEALKKALKSLSTDTWMGKIEGIRTIQRLAKTHPDVIQNQLHPIVLMLLTEVKNLRSSVARAAILAVGDLFVSLKKNVEPDLDLITSTLLSKCGETVGFIREDIEKVMNHLIEEITPSKAALAIIAGGASHRNGAVRKVAAQSLLAVVDKMGAVRILTSAKDVTEKLLPITAQFLMDGTPLTRYYGRRIYHLLMQHPSFDKLLLRYVQPSTLRNINSILDSIRKKGPGDLPKEGVSARTLKSDTYRSGLLNRTM